MKALRFLARLIAVVLILVIILGFMHVPQYTVGHRVERIGQKLETLMDGVIRRADALWQNKTAEVEEWIDVLA